jgi:hypothetical protein
MQHSSNTSDASTPRTARELRSFLSSLSIRRGSYAWNVKTYKSADDVTEDELSSIRAEHGIRSTDSVPPFNGAAPRSFDREWIAQHVQHSSGAYPHVAEESARELAWTYAEEEASELFTDSVTVESDGRSGGWLVLRGIDVASVTESADAFDRLESACLRLAGLARALARVESGAAADASVPGSELSRSYLVEALRLGELELSELASESVGLELSERVDAARELAELEELASSAGPLLSDEERRRELRSVLGVQPGERAPRAWELTVPTDAGVSLSLDSLRTLVSEL